jgi:hypothetical protein
VYNLKAGFILVVLYVLYVWFLRKETFYGFNRAYLLFGLAISFILPALNISMERLNSQGQNNFIYIEETFNELSETLNYVETEAANNVNSFPVIHYLLLLGMCIAVLRVGFQLFSIYKNIRA